MQTAVDAGQHPFLVGCTSGTTVPGAFDQLDELVTIAKKHDAWVHVDASYGGSVLFSENHRHLMAGVERTDSVTWNPHKMMGVPLTCSATLMRQPGSLAGTLGMHAEYLFHSDPAEDASCCDIGDMTLQCGRRVDALKLWLSWQAMGDQGFSRRVDTLFGLARQLADEITKRTGFELTRDPMGANVCFRYLPPGLRNEEGESRLQHQSRVTLEVRKRMLHDGRFMVNFAMLDGAQVFRPALTNPSTTFEDLRLLLDEIEQQAADIG
jgi:glutamate/tyrosine decarboxylase-like PLP-dependent enzyme